MTNDKKLELLRQMLDKNDTTPDDVANAYLVAAESAVLNIVFPFGNGSEVMPEKYEYEQIEIAAYMLNKRGAEGETAHNEGGVNRTFEAADVPTSLRIRLTSNVGGFGV